VYLISGFIKSEPMISIKIENSEELVEKKKGWLISRAISYIGKSTELVDQAVVDEIKKVFADKGIKAQITIEKESS
jgi:hypothetical protein